MGCGNRRCYGYRIPEEVENDWELNALSPHVKKLTACCYQSVLGHAIQHKGDINTPTEQCDYGSVCYSVEPGHVARYRH